MPERRIVGADRADDPALVAWARDGWQTMGALVEGPSLDALTAAADAVVAEAVRRARYPSRERAARIVQKWPIAAPAAGPFLDLVRTPARLAALRARVESDALRVVGLHLIVKPPAHALVVPWHRDGDVWPTTDLRGVTVWLALDDVGADSGGVRYHPGSHRTGGFLDPAGPDPTTPDVRAGEALVHHAALWHTTGPNRTARWRRAMVLSLAPAASPRRSGAWDERATPLLLA